MYSCVSPFRNVSDPHPRYIIPLKNRVPCPRKHNRSYSTLLCYHLLSDCLQINAVATMEICVMQCPSVELDNYIPQLFELINHAYHSQDRSYYGSEDLFTSQRLLTHEQLIQELGKHGLVAVARVVQDHDSSNDEVMGNRVFAVACLKPWKGKTVDLWEKQNANRGIHRTKDVLADDAHPIREDWEVACCASINDPTYRKRGLITQCLAALVEYLHKTLQSVYIENGKQISLWVTALEGVGTVEYWQRRGFEMQGGPDLAPVGLWGASRSFRIATLKKTISFSS